MKVLTLAGTRTLSGEPERSTAYYYADIERLKRKNAPDPEKPNPGELSEHLESNAAVDEGPVNEVPPLRDRWTPEAGKLPPEWTEPPPIWTPEYQDNRKAKRNWSPEYAQTRKGPLRWSPESSKESPDSIYNVPERVEGRECPYPVGRKEETYSTAGTFPMPEPKEKEPLLAELEVVGRLPLTQLDSSSSVRRSRSWYLCCPNVEEDTSRDSSWRYSSLRPVMSPPAPGQNGIPGMVAGGGGGRQEELASVRAERDGLARALGASRARAAAAARAHDARLAELHGVIAELVRRRSQDRRAGAIPEEDVSDECESSTQPAGELDDDADRSRTDQNDSSSMLSAGSPPRREPAPSHDPPRSESRPAPAQDTACDSSLQLSERDSELCVTTARCCQLLRAEGAEGGEGGAGDGAGGSCDREHGSEDCAGVRLHSASPGRCAARQAKLAARVRLRRPSRPPRPPRPRGDQPSADEAWCAEAASRLALDVCAQADLREALVSAGDDGAGGADGADGAEGLAAAWRLRAARLRAERRVLRCALARAADTAHRVSCACAVQESTCVALCGALAAADRALEAYDVLLALAETAPHPRPDPAERSAAELVARRLLARLDAAPPPALGAPLLSPGPWLHPQPRGEAEAAGAGAGAWSARCEARLRAHAARLKADTVALRAHAPPPHLFSYHDVSGEELPHEAGDDMQEMEAAVMLQEVLAQREARAVAALRARGLRLHDPDDLDDPDYRDDAEVRNDPAHKHREPEHHHDPGENHHDHSEHKSSASRGNRARHWLHTGASETEL